MSYECMIDTGVSYGIALPGMAGKEYKKSIVRLAGSPDSRAQDCQQIYLRLD